MNYQELIDRMVESTGLSADEIAVIRIDFPARLITILSVDARKFSAPMDQEQAKSKPKRVKAVKEVD